MEFRKDLTHLGWEEVRNRQKKRLPLVEEWARIAGIEEGITLLDIGSGPGVFLDAYSERIGEQGRVIALEKSMEAVQSYLRHSNRANVKVVCWDAEQPYPEDLRDIDVITLTDVLHHADSIQAILRNVHALASANTRILISEFDPDAEGRIGPPLAHRISMGELRSVAATQGFEGIGEGKQDFEHYFLLLRRG
ncbi:class I SAM-dependent methyltransferase [Cohnella caldifontis]|uniref:class I SAM-dependent methyltransferase n=1 Tax=Cohnella caldifontis TaxID=3027471 RepID=UPI0023EC86BB|nr:methyltransferase domain-containing protein [Cohnella sp. YIM B05605]